MRLERKVHKVLRDRRGFVDFAATPVRQEFKDPSACRDRKVPEVPEVQQERKVWTELTDLKGFVELKVRREISEQTAIRVMAELRATLERRGQTAAKASRVKREHRGQKAAKVLQALRVPSVRKATKARLGLRGLMAAKEPKVPSDLKGYRVTLASRDLTACRERWALKVDLVISVPKDPHTKERRAHRDHREHRDQLGLKDSA